MSAVSHPDIAQLKELPLPVPPVSYLPQTWGWPVLLVLLLALLATWLVRRQLRLRRERYRHEALAQLEALSRQAGDPQTRLRALRALPELLKRVALSMPDAPGVARLSGADWQAFLQRHGGASVPDDFARQLALLAYAPDERVQAFAEADAQALLGTCKQWIEAHHVAV